MSPSPISSSHNIILTPPTAPLLANKCDRHQLNQYRRCFIDSSSSETSSKSPGAKSPHQQMVQTDDQKMMATPSFKKEVADAPRLPFLVPIAPAGNKRQMVFCNFSPIERIKVPELEDDITPLSTKLPSLTPRHAKKPRLSQCPQGGAGALELAFDARPLLVSQSSVASMCSSDAFDSGADENDERQGGLGYRLL